MSHSVESNPLSNGSAPEMAAECTKWENRCAELVAERDQLRDELAKAKQERDEYLKSLYQLLCKDYVPPPFTKEEALSQLDGPTLGDLIKVLDRHYAPGT